MQQDYTHLVKARLQVEPAAAFQETTLQGVREIAELLVVHPGLLRKLREERISTFRRRWRTIPKIPASDQRLARRGEIAPSVSEAKVAGDVREDDSIWKEEDVEGGEEKERKRGRENERGAAKQQRRESLAMAWRQWREQAAISP